MGARQLWLVRHGESEANVAAMVAERNGLDVIDAGTRDANVPLSTDGRAQSEALGRWLAENGDVSHPSAIWASSYLRAQETIDIAIRAAGLDMPIRVDERLRDRELGILDLLTSQGVEHLHPGEAARRRWLGKFYYRPPGGESWADVALRVRSFLRDVDDDDDSNDDDAGCILVAVHDAVVFLFLYVCGGLTERELLDFSRTHVVLNASITRLDRPTGSGLWTMTTFAETEHLEREEVPVTAHPGDKDAAVH